MYVSLYKTGYSRRASERIHQTHHSVQLQVFHGYLPWLLPKQHTAQSFMMKVKKRNYSKWNDRRASSSYSASLLLGSMYVTDSSLYKGGDISLGLYMDTRGCIFTDAISVREHEQALLTGVPLLGGQDENLARPSRPEG